MQPCQPLSSIDFKMQLMIAFHTCFFFFFSFPFTDDMDLKNTVDGEKGNKLLWRKD